MAPAYQHGGEGDKGHNQRPDRRHFCAAQEGVAGDWQDRRGCSHARRRRVPAQAQHPPRRERQQHPVHPPEHHDPDQPQVRSRDREDVRGAGRHERIPDVLAQIPAFPGHQSQVNPRNRILQGPECRIANPGAPLIHCGHQRREPVRQNPEPGSITMQCDASDRMDAGPSQVRAVIVAGRVPQSPGCMEARCELDHIADD